MGNKTIEEIKNMIEILAGFSKYQKDLIKEIAEESYNIGIKAGEHNYKIKMDIVK